MRSFQDPSRDRERDIDRDRFDCLPARTPVPENGVPISFSLRNEYHGAIYIEWFAPWLKHEFKPCSAVDLL